MQAFKCILSPHDFFFYVTRELRTGVPSDIISNLALLYAFNNHLPQLHRNASGNRPHYVDDIGRFSVYVTPGAMEEKNVINKCGKIEEWDHVSREPKRITYNAVHTVTNVTDTSQAMPALGSYMKYPPLTPFYCFTIGGKGSNIIRLGKKLIPVRVSYYPIQDIKIHKNEEFCPNHPVNPNDLPPSIEVLECTLEVIPPIPIYRYCRLKGDFIQGRVGDKTYRIALPDPEKFSSVIL